MSNELPHVYQYRDFVTFLLAYISERRTQQPWFSARWIVKRAGLVSPAQFSMVLSRKRVPTLEFVEKACQALALSAEETRYSVLLTERELDRSPILTALVSKELASIAQKNGWTRTRAETAPEAELARYRMRPVPHEPRKPG